MKYAYIVTYIILNKTHMQVHAVFCFVFLFKEMIDFSWTLKPIGFVRYLVNKPFSSLRSHLTYETTTTCRDILSGASF